MANPTIPTTPTFASETPVFAPLLRASVADCTALYLQRPLFIAQDTSGNSIPSGAATNLGWTAELADTWNGHITTGAANQAYYCQFPGWYLCRLAVVYSYGSATAAPFACGFQGNTAGASFGPFFGAQISGGSTHGPQPQAVDLIEQTRTGPVSGLGDYIQGFAYQATGAGVATDAAATWLPYISVRWVAAQTGTTGLPVPSNPAWPAPAANITSAFGNTNIRDAIRFLIYPPVCRAWYNPGSSSLPTQTFPAATVINLNTVTVDNYSGFTTGASGGYTAPVAGNYLVYGQFNLAASASATGYCAGLRVNSGTVQWGDSIWNPSGAVAGAQVCKRLRLSSGDFVQLMGSQQSSGAIGYNGLAINQTRMVVVWEGS